MTRNHAAPVLQDVVHMTDDSDDNGQFKTLQKSRGWARKANHFAPVRARATQIALHTA